MIKYRTWKEYLASEQDSYLDEDNRADCDVQYHVGDLLIDGQTALGAYAVTTADGQLIGIYTTDYIAAVDQITDLYLTLGLMTEENCHEEFFDD